MKFSLLKIDESRFTHDYNQMLMIVVLNSLGFFFIGFWIPLVAIANMTNSLIVISLVVTSNVIGRMISGFIVGFITDRIKSRTKLVLVGSFGRAIAYFIIYASFITSQILVLGIGHFILGFMAGVFWVPYNILVAEKSNKNNRSQAYGKRDSMNAIGQIIGGTFGFTILMISSIFTDNPVIIYSAIPIYGLSNIFAGILFNRKVDETIKFSSIQDIKNEEKKPRSKVLTSPLMIIGALFLLAVLFLGSINATIARPYLNIYLTTEIMGLPASEADKNLLAVWAYLPAGLLATILAPKLGTLVDKLRPFVGITITGTLGALMTWFVINSPNIWIFSILLLFDLAIGMAAGLIFQNLMSRISTEHRGKIFGVGDFFTFLGNTIGPIIGGVVYQLISPQFPFIISIFIELSLIPLYLMAVRLLLPHIA
ncbi:MAG: MFS transporter, partial [Promethearchaeota archaeon]